MQVPWLLTLLPSTPCTHVSIPFPSFRSFPPPPPQLLGPAIARARLLESRGFKVVSVPISDWAALKDSKAKASYLLKAVRAAAPGAASKVRSM